jgi:uncharacterized protein (DUF433 family)
MAAKLPSVLNRRLYSYADADRIAAVSRGTSKRWIEGYTRKAVDGARASFPPVTPGRTVVGEGVSFFDLVEILAIGSFRDIGFPVRTVRRIVEECQQLFGVEHPLSMLEFKASGRSIFVKKDGVLRDVLKRKAQPAWDEILGPFLEKLDYRDAVAHRYWPLGQGQPVVIDPEYGFGQPVVAGSGVRTEIVLERVRAGDANDEIAKDFGLSKAEVESAIQYEVQRAS